MPRRLGDELNELRFQDNISGSTIVLYYRMPTTQETVRYTNEITVRQRNRIVSRLGETRQKYGFIILQGIRTGDFEVKKGDKYVPIASDPQSEYYVQDWKETIKKHAPDLIELLAIRVFESPAEEDIEPEDTEGEPQAPGDEAEEPPDLVLHLDDAEDPEKN